MADDDPVVCPRCGVAYPPGTIFSRAGIDDICDQCYWEEIADEED